MAIRGEQRRRKKSDSQLGVHEAKRVVESKPTDITLYLHQTLIGIKRYVEILRYLGAYVKSLSYLREVNLRLLKRPLWPMTISDKKHR